ncbi:MULTISPECIES: hypothetical protein [unclassified Sphingobium]|uniref:hypothetical protein n=1 Tax=unclassified Sphingobium TaxID=2611147 RepID=UPI0035A5D757
MASAIARRIARLEQGRAAIVPHVIEVATGETDEQAIGRFVARHGRAPASCIVLPARATDDELADLEPLWAEQQRRLVADARTETRKLKEAPNGRRNAQRIISRNPGSRVLPSKHAVADAAKRDDRQS